MSWNCRRLIILISIVLVFFGCESRPEVDDLQELVVQRVAKSDSAISINAFELVACKKVIDSYWCEVNGKFTTARTDYFQFGSFEIIESDTYQRGHGYDFHCFVKATKKDGEWILTGSRFKAPAAYNTPAAKS